ncbi:MAG TPA: S8 family peptidase, partial [Pyrinomonadaceae bacterium]|nr:S8 family peptidase [Pyrinomonadaceae bacterium]
MFRSLLRRKLAPSSRARRLALVVGLLVVAASVPLVSHGAFQQDEIKPPSSSRKASVKGETQAAPDFAPGRVLVRFRTDTLARGAETLSGAVRSKDGKRDIPTRLQRFEGSSLVKGLRIAYVDPADTLQAVEAYKARADVLYAEPDYLRYKQAVPNDPEFVNLWAMRNTGQQITVKLSGTGPGVYQLCGTNASSYPCTFPGGVVGADMKLEQAWNITTGSPNIVVGVIDEGVDISHPDLAANIFRNLAEVNGTAGVDDDGNGKVDDFNGWDFSGGAASNNACDDPNPNADPGCGDNSVFDGNVNPNPYPFDEMDAHGTHVSGTIGAVGNNGVGVAGVNWTVKIMPLKFINGATGSTSNAVRAAAYAKAMRDKWVATGGAQGANVRVLNNSYGGGEFSQSELDAIKSLGEGNSKILFVTSAGNETTNNDKLPSYPAGYDAPNLIAVAATGNQRSNGSISNDDLASYSNFGESTVSVAAPGSLILSTTPNNTYDYYFGTSMASPQVAGVAALVCSLNPEISVSQLRGALAFSGDVIEPAIANRLYSRRRLNALSALQAAQENDSTPPAAPSDFRVTSQSGSVVNLAWTATGDDGTSGQAALNAITLTDTSVAPARTFLLKTLIPHAAGTTESVAVNLPFRHPAGTLRLKTIDNLGNESSTAFSVNGDATVVDPLVPSLSAAGALSVGGTPQNLRDDDAYRNYALPAGFNFRFFGQTYDSLVISTNGALYFQPLSTLPLQDNGTGGDAGPRIYEFDLYRMIAGLWTDIRTDTNNGGDVYVVEPDAQHPDRIIFRWRGRTFSSTGTDAGGEVNFEIELQRGGTIITRYGAGNNIVPPNGVVVGVSGGALEPYVIPSHTRDIDDPRGGIFSLNNASTVTFAVRPTVDPGPQSIQFGSATFTEPENSASLIHSAAIRVTRTGNTSVASSVTVRTID